MSDMVHSILPALGALAAVLGLVLAAGRAARRFGGVRGRPPGTARRLALCESLPIDRTRRLHLVRCDERDLLIISGGNTADTVIGWLPLPGVQA